MHSTAVTREKGIVRSIRAFSMRLEVIVGFMTLDLLYVFSNVINEKYNNVVHVSRRYFNATSR